MQYGVINFMTGQGAIMLEDITKQILSKIGYHYQYKPERIFDCPICTKRVCTRKSKQRFCSPRCRFINSGRGEKKKAYLREYGMWYRAKNQT